MYSANIRDHKEKNKLKKKKNKRNVEKYVTFWQVADRLQLLG